MLRQLIKSLCRLGHEIFLVKLAHFFGFFNREESEEMKISAGRRCLTEMYVIWIQSTGRYPCRDSVEEFMNIIDRSLPKERNVVTRKAAALAVEYLIECLPPEGWDTTYNVH